MPITKIYIESNFVAIDNGSELINYIPNGNSDFEHLGNGNYCVFKSGGQLMKNYSFNYLDVRTKAGAAIGGGTEAEVVLYLTTVFNTASGGSEAYLQSRIVVTQEDVSTTLGGIIDSTKEYFLDGVIDMGSTQITVPSGGVNIKGFDFNVSGLTSSENTYTMFTGATAGDVLLFDFKIEVTGTGSKVFDLTNSSGLNAFEISRINFNGCTSLGELDGYRQGLETGTGRFGGTPNLIFSGTWLGGYFIDTSIVRSLTAGAYSIYEVGTSFLMNSRFRSNQNIELPTTASFIDFARTNFANPNTLQLDNCIVSRNGIFDATDTSIIPNIDRGDVECYFKGNTGLFNTYVGGKVFVNSTVTTVVSATSTFYTLNGTWSYENLQHFDNPASGELRHLGVNPIEFNLVADLTLDSNSNDVLEVRLRKWNNSTSSFENFGNQVRQVNNLVGGRDVAFFTILESITLNQNDYVFLQVANNSDNTDITAEIGSFIRAEAR
tara:strand:+ start:154 stop:1629 length:1476 start_codon:yes stop_codon:yes gene_type:complete